MFRFGQATAIAVEALADWAQAMGGMWPPPLSVASAFSPPPQTGRSTS
jgi:hypothetical protein